MKLAIYGYGNLGRGVEAAAHAADDIEVYGIFTRRDPAAVEARYAPVYPAAHLSKHVKQFDVLALCGGSAVDLPVLTPRLAECCSVVDSFDTHATFETHFAAVDAAARRGGTVALVGAGWDPGLFSVARTYAAAILPDGVTYTFWGDGVSQGHSEAIRRIDGVRDARQYTCPRPDALARVRAGETPALTPREMHTRVCFVVAEEGADTSRIAQEIRTMPHYFSDYDTDVYFISQEELNAHHTALPHGGTVLRTGIADESRHTAELRLRLASNPAFTGSILCACARAVARLAAQGECGCRTMLDLPPALLSPVAPEWLRRNLV